MADKSPTLLVTGAGGHLGRRVVELLLAAGGARVIAGSRDPGGLADLEARGAETRRVDFEAPGLAAAFAGVDRLLIVSTDAIDRPGRRLAQHRAAVAAAEAAGVAHVVYTSMPNPEPGSPIPFAPDHHGTERALAESRLGWTVLRNSWYAENLLPGLPQVLASGQWVTAAGEGRVSYVAREDAARAAAAALTRDPGGNETIDVAGPEALTAAEIAARVAEVFGRPVQVVQVSDAELAKGLEAAGLPAPMAAVYASLDTNTRLGRAEVSAGGVAALTGRAPQPLRAFLEAHRDTVLARLDAA